LDTTVALAKSLAKKTNRGMGPVSLNHRHAFHEAKLKRFQVRVPSNLYPPKQQNLTTKKISP